MANYDAIVERVVSAAQLPSAERRREVERELRAHVEDIVEEARLHTQDEGIIRQIVEARFGKSQEVADGFASVYSRERLARRVAGAGILLMASLTAVIVVISGMQSMEAIWRARSVVSPFEYLGHEVFGLSAIILGYLSLYLGERLFPRSLAKSVLVSAAIAFLAAINLSAFVPQHEALPLAAFCCAAFARLLQRVHIPFLWLAGTAGPLLIAGLIVGPLLPDQGTFPWWVWLGLTVSCWALRETVRVFEGFGILSPD
jgi:hypothetical protein